MSTDITIVLPRSIVKMDAAELEESTHNDLQKLNEIGRRAVDLSCKIGLKLIGLRSKTGYGKWDPVLERLGLSKTTAKRLMLFGQYHEFIKASLEREPNLTQQGVERLISEQQVAGLPDDMPVEEEAKEVLKRVKQKRVQDQTEQRSRRTLNAIKHAIADLEELISTDPQNPEVMACVFHLKLKAQSVVAAHEQAVADDTAPPAADAE